MSEEKQLTREEWISKIRKEGKTETIRTEMIRLGFWEDKHLTEEEKAKQAKEDEEYLQVTQELNQVQRRAKQLKNIDGLLKAARKRRIEASKKRRAERKAQRAKEIAAAKEKWQQYQETHVVHAGEGVSSGLSATDTNEAKLMQLRLPLIYSAYHLAHEMNIELPELKWLTYHRNTATINHYSRFTIPKKSGGQREISAPKPKLKHAQAWIKAHILDKLPVHSAAYGFVTGKSTVANAKPHMNKAVVVKFDLKDFFPSITFTRIRGYFQSIGYNGVVSTLLALLCSEPPRQTVDFQGKMYNIAIGERQLPQGACTSPTLTNLLCRRLDEKLSRLAAEKGFTYTRYADDLTFSASKAATKEIGSLMASVRAVVDFEGFTVNEKKTRVLRAGRRQRVTGIVVNEKANLTRHDLRRFRALLHEVEQHGLEKANRQGHPNLWAYIQGYISYVNMVHPKKGQTFATKAQHIAKKYQLHMGEIVS
jgi:retron-type reverse transcriptase